MSVRLREPIVPAAQSSGRISSLDGLRALSIAVVVLGHYYLVDSGGVAALGVYLFFAISGFLIVRLMYAELARRGSIRLRAFYARRFWRLYPVLALYVAAAVVTSAAFDIATPAIEVASVFFYFNNYLANVLSLSGQEMVLPIGVFWSLAIEEHFYIFAPLVFLLTRGRPKPMLIFAAVAIVGPLLLRIAYVTLWPEIVDKLVTYKSSETRFDSIAVGVLLAVLCEMAGGQRVISRLASWPAALLTGAVVLACLLIKDQWFRETFRFTALSLGSAVLLSFVVFGNSPLLQRLANAPPVIWLGRISYSLYVWHIFVLFVAEQAGLGDTGVVLTTAKLFIALSLATLSYRLVETPVLDWARGRMGQEKPAAVVSQ